MSNHEAGERGRGEPIDVDFEPAEHGYPVGGGIGFGSALVLAVLAAGVGAAGGALAPRVPQVRAVLDKAVPDRSAASTQSAEADSVATLDARVHALEAVLHAPTVDSAPGPDSISARVFQLQGGLHDIETRLARMPSSDQVAALVAQVQQMQQQLPALEAEAHAAGQAARASYAVSAATEASRSSGPFPDAYASLQALLPNDPNVAALAPYAQTGAPTRTELRQEFESIDNDIIRIAREAQAGAGFWGRVQATFAQWIIIRADNGGDTPDGVVDRAENRLAADDLRGAIAEVSRLTGPARQRANPWLAKAQRRLTIDERIAAIRTTLARGV